MAEDQSKDNKTEEPTGRRLSKAREEGSIARSRELPSAVMLMTGCLFIFWGGAIAISMMERIVSAALRVDPNLLHGPDSIASQGGRRNHRAGVVQLCNKARSCFAALRDLRRRPA